eukprot:COSAG02_NODE_16691_length_1063_cov_1.811203_1_plen_22_part_10
MARASDVSDAADAADLLAVLTD